jgi:hypothetical protein
MALFEGFHPLGDIRRRTGENAVNKHEGRNRSKDEERGGQDMLIGDLLR